MEETILKTAFRGLQKEAVLRNIDTLMGICLAVTSGTMDKDTALAEAKQVVDAPVKKQFGGFAEEDVRVCMQKLYDTILECQPEVK